MTTVILIVLALLVIRDLIGDYRRQCMAQESCHRRVIVGLLGRSSA